jgi:hypothetical protein
LAARALCAFVKQESGWPWAAPVFCAGESIVSSASVHQRAFRIDSWAAGDWKTTGL